MSGISVPNTFNPGDSVSSQKINANFAQFANATNRSGDTLTGALNTEDLLPTTDDTYDLGSSSHRYNKLYHSGGVQPRVTSTTSASAPAPDADTTDTYELTALAAGATFTNPSGTPVNTQKLLLSITDNGSAQSLAFGTAYADGGTTLPTTTVAGKQMYIGFIYNAAQSKWLCVGVQVQA